jgi:gluconokinase
MAGQSIILMGVSGCGKSSVGAALSKALNAKFIDGDDLHPRANIQKMASGSPLNDDDRAPTSTISRSGTRPPFRSRSSVSCS